jgi:hypothetical protein
MVLYGVSKYIPDNMYVRGYITDLVDLDLNVVGKMFIILEVLNEKLDVWLPSKVSIDD